MYNNYFLLNQLAKIWTENWKGLEVHECFSQAKREFIIRIGEGVIQCQLKSRDAYIRSPKSFHRAKKNTVNILPDLIGLRLELIQAVAYDRALIFTFSENHILYIKLHNAGANAVLYKNNELEDRFISAEEPVNLNLEDLCTQIPDKTVFDAENGNIKSVFPPIGKEALNHLNSQGYTQKTIDEQWAMFQSIIKEVESPSAYYISEIAPDDWQLTLWKPEKPAQRYEDPVEALEAFIISRHKATHLHQQKTNLLSIRKNALKKGLSYIKKTELRWEQLLEEDDFKYKADVIMANIYKLSNPRGEITLEGFNGEEMVFDFKDKSPVKFAENLYRKSKNRKIEVENVEKSLEKKQAEVERIKEEIEYIQSVEHTDELKPFTIKNNKKKLPEFTSFHETEIGGFQVLIGKNSKANDKLTFQKGFKDDLWLHVKDAPGSHVLVKFQPGKNFPDSVIEKAAAIAAWFSKRKTEGLVPVIYTPRKFIRKRKGAPPGEVVVDKEKVVLVQPENLLKLHQ